MSEIVQENTRIVPTQTSLTKEQKEAVGLLSIGTFLEYFDLLLYVHMAVLLNELFFPKTDPHTTTILSGAAFCSTYLLRPFGALIFGWIGDNIGRKATVIITTFMMSLSCLVMANLPTYEQIGVSAAWLITICRILQGMSSMGEVIGAQLYLTEMVKQSTSTRYATVAIIVTCSALGATGALGIASLVTSFGFNWRMAFWFGAGIALIGAVARTALKETPDFVNAKKRIKNIVEKANISTEELKSNPAWQEKVNRKTTIAYFLIECTGPVWFYIGYIYCGNILKNTFQYSAEQVIHQNFIVTLMDLFDCIIMIFLVYRIHPLKILKVKLIIFSIFAIICPILLQNISSPMEVLFIQVVFSTVAPTGFPGFAVFCMHFPVFKRFTYTSFIFALSRSLMFAAASFGIIYLVDYFSHWGLLFMIIPILMGYTFAISHFKKLEMANGSYN
ncbi:MAG: MFS transporter [Rickettsia endosymbiont of Platyusa sonomae]|nr:MFS transporter [Rickettsia endosymbiont of Platyusa sonomae]